MNYSHNESIDFLKKAISVLNKMPENDNIKKENVEVRRLIANPLHFSGFPESSIEILQEGATLSKTIGDKRSLSFFYYYISSYYAFKGDPLQARNYAENSYRESLKLQDLELMVQPAFSLNFSYLMSGNLLKAAEVNKDIIDLFEKTQREKESLDFSYSLFCWNYGSCMAYFGNFKEAEIFFEKGFRFVGDTHNLTNIAQGEFYYGLFYYFKGNGENTIEHLQKSLRLHEKIDFKILLAFVQSFLGLGYYLLGDLKTAREHIEKGLVIQKKSKLIWGLSYIYIFLSLVCCDAGDIERAIDCAEKALELSHKNNERQQEGLARIHLGRALVKKDPSQHDKAEKHILQGIKILEELKIKPNIAEGYFHLGEFYIDIGMKEKALKELKKAESMDKEMEREYWLKRTQGLLARL